MSKKVAKISAIILGLLSGVVGFLVGGFELADPLEAMDRDSYANWLAGGLPICAIIAALACIAVPRAGGLVLVLIALGRAVMIRIGFADIKHIDLPVFGDPSVLMAALAGLLAIWAGTAKKRPD